MTRNSDHARRNKAKQSAPKKQHAKRIWFRRVVRTLMIALLIGPLYVAAFGPINYGADWRTADRTSTGLATPADQIQEAIIEVYSARAFNWRGVFGVHMWISTKEAGADTYETHQVLGWQKFRGLPVVVSGPDLPDRSWYGHTPEKILEIRGEKAGTLIPQIKDAVASYPYPDTYHVWPGPNSNTFIAWIARAVPDLQLQLPSTAIGKDYLPLATPVTSAPSGTGKLLSLYGLLGVTVAKEEGIEFNLLALNFGIDFNDFALILPGIDRVGFHE